MLYIYVIVVCNVCSLSAYLATILWRFYAFMLFVGALPFKCAWEGCTKTFAKEYMMKYHMKMWHECETKACEICFKQIKVRVYKRHMLTHTGQCTTFSVSFRSV